MGLLIIRSYNEVLQYSHVLQNMQSFTTFRKKFITNDEIWLLEHYPVYTLGYRTAKKNIIQNSSIPVVQTDRGGQITYHGPGQLIGYFMIDLKASKYKVHDLVHNIEQIIITLLKKYDINARTKPNAPGIYCHDQKICSLGLRIKRGYSYHGFALNVNLDITPFNKINPCGYKNLKMCQISDFITQINVKKVIKKIITIIEKQLDYTNIKYVNYEN